MDEDIYSSADSEEIKEIADSIAQDLVYMLRPDEENHDDNITSCHIPRVHQLVRQIDRFAYEPSVLSIGPYHHGNASLQFMERLKWRCLDYVLHLNCTKSLRDYLLVVSNMENQARACYSGEIKLDSKAFRRMLLLDGCFIMVYLRGTHGVSRITKADPEPSIIPDENVALVNSSPEKGAKGERDEVHEIELGEVDADQHSSENKDSTSCKENSGVPWYHIFALVDLFLLENQIPFFVVKKLHEVLLGSSMERILTKNFSNYIEVNMKQCIIGAFSPDEKPNDFDHLLHLCHMHFKPTMVREGRTYKKPKFSKYFLDKIYRMANVGRQNVQYEYDSPHSQQFNFLQGRSVNQWRRATQYHEAGIVFKRNEVNGQNKHSLLDVAFHDGVLEIPCLYVDERTGSLFRNMISFEQTNPQFANCVTAYVMFMSQLLSRPDDVTLLSRRGIIVHFLHSDKVVSALFTRLTKGVVFDYMGSFYLRSVCWRMEMFYQNRINRWIAWLRHNHLSNPWLGAALMAGLLVLFCTIAQTVLTEVDASGSKGARVLIQCGGSPLRGADVAQPCCVGGSVDGTGTLLQNPSPPDPPLLKS
ncbi:hypothetical protein U9M48_040985 [Paspalum notatum var. saurae]|uniref:Uncharacterized protein n=1 Tax=Paspalum notatum var. saurae TaxID=547442 RepID=A0AAQ3UMU4_PASNO